MNEHIKAILDESTDDILGVKVVNQEKFAELLVQSVIDEYAKHTTTEFGAMRVRAKFKLPQKDEPVVEPKEDTVYTGGKWYEP